MLRGILGFLVLAFIVAAIFGSNSPQTNTPSAPLIGPPRPTVVPPMSHDKITLVKVDWSRAGFGSIAIASFTIRNDNEYEVRDIELRCDFYGNSGTRLHSRDQTIYERLGAKKQRSFREINLGFIDQQAARAGCRIVGAKP